MESTLTHRISVRLADELNKYVYREGLEYKKVVLGAEIILMNLSKLAVIFALSVLLGVFKETVLTLIGFNVLRRSAFGLHALSSTKCIVTTIVLFIVVPYFIRGYVLHNFIVFLIFTGILAALYLYAPSDTEARPILGAKKRAKLKKTAMISGIILMLAVLAIPYNDIKLMVTLGAVYEAVFVLPITYIILKRRRNNYESFDK